MLFLARDNISYLMAKNMFPHVEVKSFPDIVTSLIGLFLYKYKKRGVCLCVRDDSEKFYSDEQLSILQSQLEKETTVVRTDTKRNIPYMSIRKNIQNYIENTIEDFSTYEVTITDRYHGTIFSLAAGTPVIVIKSTDHKIVTGIDWFKGIYDDYVYSAKF